MGARDVGLDVLKVAAAGLMTLDHAARVLGGGEPVVWLLLGRLALPFFAVALAVGVVHYSRDVGRLLGRVLFVAVLAQVPFVLALGEGAPLNVLFTLAAGVGVGLVARSNVGAFVAGLPVAMLLDVAGCLPVDGGGLAIWGVGCCIRGAAGDRSAWVGAAVMFFLVYRVGGGLDGLVYGLTAAGGVPLGLGLLRVRGVWLPVLPGRWLYWYYPVHLLVLVWVASWLGVRG